MAPHTIGCASTRMLFQHVGDAFRLLSRCHRDSVVIGDVPAVDMSQTLDVEGTYDEPKLATLNFAYNSVFQDFRWH